MADILTGLTGAILDASGNSDSFDHIDIGTINKSFRPIMESTYQSYKTTFFTWPKFRASKIFAIAYGGYGSSTYTSLGVVYPDSRYIIGHSMMNGVGSVYVYGAASGFMGQISLSRPDYVGITVGEQYPENSMYSGSVNFSYIAIGN